MNDARDSLEKEVFRLPEGWSWQWFTDVMDIQGGTQPPASQFIDEWREGYIRLVQIRDFESDQYLTYIPRSGNLKICHESDTLVGRYGAAVGRICQGLSGAYNVALAKVVINSDLLHPPFVKYLLRSDIFQGPLLSSSGRSAQSGFNKGDLSVIPLPFPPRKEQEAISQVLGMLEEKIELNKKVNLTIEGMAKAVFKSWFIDFDPVKAKNGGRSTELPGEIGNLFPDSFDESDLGLIPSGWEWSYLNEIALNPRDTVKPGEIKESDQYIGLEHMPRGSICLNQYEQSVVLESNKNRFLKEDLLYGKLRPYFKKTGYALFDGICSTDIVVVRAKDSCTKGFICCLLASDPFIDFTVGASSGTRMPRTSWKDMSKFPFPFPDRTLLELFESLFSSQIQRIQFASEQNRVLSSIRDALLPRLISGELRVPDVEKMLEEVGV